FSGRAKKLLPLSTNDPRFPPSILRRTAYFQYAAWSITSQILCRPGPGRHAACFAVTPLMDCLRFGPCQVFFSKPSSSSASTSFAESTGPPHVSAGEESRQGWRAHSEVSTPGSLCGEKRGR